MPTINLPPKKEYKRQNNSSKRSNENHKNVYNTQLWRELRLNYLMQNPLCFECLKKGLFISAVDIHHIIPISSTNDIQQKKALGFDYNNLKGLCKNCHKIEHQTRNKN